MKTSLRKAFNEKFTPEKYQAFLNEVNSVWDKPVRFRVAETPVFATNELKEQLMEACNEIYKTIKREDFKALTDRSLEHPSLNVPNENDHTHFLQMDFGVCMDANGEIVPQLIEIQGFPTLYFFQDMVSKAYKKVYDIPEGLTSYFGGLDSKGYIEELRKVIVGDSDPKNVILLEIEPETQTTSIDFYGAEKHMGIKVLCISDMKKRGRELYYLGEDGVEVKIERIFNRVIFDELDKRDDLEREFYFDQEVDVVWVGHPNWFFRISKFTMPLFKSKYAPDCFYLNELSRYPGDLENYVLKPLYSFAGSGVKLNITKADLDSIEDKAHYILQRKVTYHPIIETPTGDAKFEIRMLMLWPDGAPEAKIVNNLVRISKGEMVGVRYNKDKDWVGGSVAFFPEGD